MVLPVSRSTANALLEMGIPASRIEVLSNGVDPVDLSGVEHEDGRVLFVGRLEREKGVLDAISVIEGLTGGRSPRARRHRRRRQSRGRRPTGG